MAWLTRPKVDDAAPWTCPLCRHPNAAGAVECQGRPNSKACDYRPDPLPDFEYKTLAFATLYREVTHDLLSFAHFNTGQHKEQNWFDYVVKSFFNYYNFWRHSAMSRSYLKRANRSPSPRLYRLICHAYLHIAFDLPRSLAESLSNDPGKSWHHATDDFGEPIPQVITLATAERLYFNASPLFYEIMGRCAKRHGIAGIFLPTAYLPRPLNVLDMVGHWIIALRSASWRHVRRLRKARATGRSRAYEYRLMQAVERAAKDTNRFNPFTWISRLRPQFSLLQVVPLLIFDARLVAIALVALLATWWLYTYLWLLVFSNRFGGRIYKALEELAVDKEFSELDEPDDETPRQTQRRRPPEA